MKVGIEAGYILCNIIKKKHTYINIYLFVYLITVQKLSLETDKIYPSAMLLLTFLKQNNIIYLVKDRKSYFETCRYIYNIEFSS